MTVECGLCGRRFREDRGQAACAACPLSRGCRYVRCPYCGFENPVAPAWLGGRAAGRKAAEAGSLGPVGRLRRWLGGAGRAGERPGRRAPGRTGSLLDLAPGDVAAVVDLADPSGPEGRALAGLGVLPGVVVEVVQRYPAWIVRLDRAELAFDDALAAAIRVSAAPAANRRPGEGPAKEGFEEHEADRDEGAEAPAA